MPNPSKAPAQERLTAEADQSHEGQRLDRFLSMRLPGLSRTRVQSLIKEGHASCGGATIEDVKYRVKLGDRFELTVPPAAPSELGAEAIPLTIVYEDEALVVIDKPAGLVVHPGAGHATGTLANALHALAEQFADHGRSGELERGYLALVWGAPPRPQGTIDAPVGRHPTSRTK